MMNKRVGVAGLGAMGFQVAITLKKAGFEIIGYDAFQGVYEKAEAEGITMVYSMKEMAEKVDEAIISMVRNYEQNIDIIFGDGGLSDAEQAGKTIIVMSTLDPESMRQLSEKVREESDMNIVDAGLSGGVAGAESGTLSIMTSGPEKIVKSLQPIFDVIGSETFYYGEDPGNSQAAKLINNMVLGINVNAVAEGLELAKKYDLPQEELLKLLQASTGDSWVVRNWDTVSEWTTDATLSILQKDLTAAYKEGINNDVSLPLNALASTRLFEAMRERKKS